MLATRTPYEDFNCQCRYVPRRFHRVTSGGVVGEGCGTPPHRGRYAQEPEGEGKSIHITATARARVAFRQPHPAILLTAGRRRNTKARGRPGWNATGPFADLAGQKRSECRTR